MKKAKSIIITAIMALLLTSCIQLNVGSDHRHIDYAIRMLQVQGEIVTTANVSNRNPDGTLQSASDIQPIVAAGFYYGSGYFITEEHCILVEEKAIVQFGQWTSMVDRQINNVSHTVDGKPAKLLGHKWDMAVFEVPGSDVPGVQFNTNRLVVGQELAVLGRSFLGPANFKRGIVSALTIPDLFDSIFSNGYMAITVPINGGDSGSAVFTEEEGKLVCAGMVTAIVAGQGAGGGYSIAYRGGYLKNEIDRIINSSR